MKTQDVLERIKETKHNTEFLGTGIKKIDDALDGGFLKKEIVVLGAFTGIGKSMFAGQLLYNIAQKGFTSGYFSLEISNEMIVSRIIGQLANIKPARILHGLLQPDEYDAKAMATAKLLTYNEAIYFHDDLYLLGEIEEKIKEEQLEFVVIDFIQNILLEANMDEYARLTYIAIQLQKIAKETNTCILLLSQLSNKVGSRNEKVNEYKGSGAIAQIADLGFFLERGEPILDINGQPTGNQPVTLYLRKNRRGVSGIFWDLAFTHPGGLIS